MSPYSLPKPTQNQNIKSCPVKLAGRQTATESDRGSEVSSLERQKATGKLTSSLACSLGDHSLFLRTKWRFKHQTTPKLIPT
ncbi:hypothetical protein A2U01_0070712, partial [Trifolium medium]|nr:hypothetical protein [Trifolium medium]